MNRTDLPDRLRQLFIRWIFVVVPTAVIGYVTLVYVNFSYTSFATSIGRQALFYSAGLILAYSIYFFRARWVVTFVALWLVYWLASKIIVKLPGEFDVFYATARFQLNYSLFLFGWIFGFLLVRVRFSYIILCAILTVVTVVAISNTIDISLTYILLHLVPVVVYALYMLFLSPLVMEDLVMNWKKSGRLFLRFVFFLIVVLLAFVLVDRLFRTDLRAVEKELAARGAKENKKEGGDQTDGGYDERYGLMDKPGHGDDGYRLKDTMKLSSKMSQSDNLMFCSKLENYYPDGTPKPLYFVYHYLTRYDPEKESFTRDIKVPYFDEFDADPSEIAMYHSREDTTIIFNSLAKKKRFVVEAKIYLSSNTWKHALLAPGAVYYCQTIPIEKDFQKTFLAAYKVKSYTSELNNAYFVYNPSANPMLERYQQERYEELRKAEGYQNVDSAFYVYYTQLPKGVLYDSISRLAHSLTPLSDRPVDKVIAVRDFFLQRDKNGKRIFRYTLKPGQNSDPNIPTALMLRDFLFKTRAGYCTYYAGASLFLLRSLGIPSRFTTGFATIDRTDKNKGWYWFYASQAHAWTQVYFPGYGWLDFDMTIGNEDQQGAPRPDGTPPLPPPEPWLVLNSRAETTADPKSKRLDISFNRIIYFDKPYQLGKTFTRTIDASRSRVLYDKKDTTLACIQPGDSLIVVSYKDEAKKIPSPRAGVAIETQVEGFPAPVIADEIHVKPRAVAAKKDSPAKPSPTVEQGITWQEVLRAGVLVLAGVMILILLLPALIGIYLVLRTRWTADPTSRADRIYTSALYQFHMAGIERVEETPLNYARTKVDPAFASGFEEFMTVYLRLKYGKESPRDEDLQIIDRFAKACGSSVRRKTGVFRMLLNYFNLLRASRYFFKSETNETAHQSLSL